VTGRFQDLGGRRDILPSVPKVLENTIPDPVGGFNHLRPDPVPMFIRLTDPERRACGSLVLHETTCFPLHAVVRYGRIAYTVNNRESPKLVNLKRFLRPA
jgi:hypothetical protein